MPTHMHQHDKHWVKEILSGLPFAMRARAAKKYSEIYLETETASTNKLSPEGDARFEANTRLRLFAERANNVNNGAVIELPKVK